MAADDVCAIQPITVIYRGDDEEDGDQIFQTLMHSIAVNTAQWAAANGVTTAGNHATGEVRLPFVVPKATGPQPRESQPRSYYWEFVRSLPLYS